MGKGLFIAIEGIDGAGTTTQSQLLYEEFVRREKDRKILQVKEPSNTPVTSLIRQWLKPTDPGMPPLAMLIAFTLDRYIHMRNVVEPCLREGAIVVSDRSKMSTLAYQAIELPMDLVRLMVDEHRDPDVYVFLEVKSETALERVRRRPGQMPDRYETEEFQKKVINGYEDAIAATPVDVIRVREEGKSITQIHDEIVSKLVSAGYMKP